MREEREAAYTAALDEVTLAEDQALATSAASVTPTPEGPVSSPASAEAESVPTPEADALASPTETPAWSAASSSGPGTAWSPPEAAAWQPSDDSEQAVSWSESELFRDRDDQFPEPEHIPRVSAGQLPSADTSDYAFGAATPALAALMPVSDVDRTYDELAQAGYHQPHAMQNLQALRFLLVFVSLIMLGGLLLVVPTQAEPWVLGSMLIIPAALWAVPRILIQNKATERRSQLERAVPDMLDMLNMCVSQGLPIPDSLKRIASDLKPVYPVLAGELAIVVQQAEVGNLRIVLENFARRVNVPEVDSFTNLMTQSDRMGTSASNALTEYSSTMRESLRQRTDEKANSAAFKLMFPTVLFMMPAVFMFLMGPAILELQEFFDGGGLQQIREGTGTATSVLQQNN
jgi:tight adherence protein C